MTRNLLAYIGLVFLCAGVAQGQQTARPLNSRAQFVASFNAAPMRVSMPRDIGIAQLSREVGTEAAQRILTAYSGTKATKQLAIVGGLRGGATRVKIVIREETAGAPAFEITGFAKGDPRTEQGKQNIRANTSRALARFRDAIIAREAFFDQRARR